MLRRRPEPGRDAPWPGRPRRRPGERCPPEAHHRRRQAGYLRSPATARAAERTRQGAEDRRANSDARNVDLHAVGKTLEVDLAGRHEAGECVLGTAERAGECAAHPLAPGHRVVGIAGQRVTNGGPPLNSLVRRRADRLTGSPAGFCSRRRRSGRSCCFSCRASTRTADRLEGGTRYSTVTTRRAVRIGAAPSTASAPVSGAEGVRFSARPPSEGSTRSAVPIEPSSASSAASPPPLASRGT